MFLYSIIILFLGIFINIPIGFCLLLASLTYIILLGDIPLSIVMHGMFAGVNNFVLLSVPFFILMGELMNQGGVTKKIYRFALALIGHFPGGLAYVNVIASIIFSGMSGSAVADVGGLGNIEIKAMVDDGYDREFSAGITAASATIGPIIPPSIPIIIYGVYANVSIIELFVAGFLPGILIGIVLMAYSYIISCRRKYPIHKKADFKELIRSFFDALPSLLAPGLLIGGIISGVFTPTECGAAAAAYALFLTVIIYKKIKMNELPSIFLKVAKVTAFVMLLVSAASVFSWLLVLGNIPVRITQSIIQLSTNKFVILALINILLLIVGCFIGPIPAIMILVPVLCPIVTSIGIDLTKFGIIMVFNLVIGLLTPPVASVLYIVSNISKVPFAKMCRVIIPFYIPLLIALLIITYTQITLILPNILFR